MGEVWIRTISNSLVRADKVTEIASTRGSLHDDQGYALKVIVDGKAHVIIDDGGLPGSSTERQDYARHLEDALLFALDEAQQADASVVVSFEPETEGWALSPAADLAGRISAGS
ncbi:hypothetical protein [Pseudarthrobacter sp. TAF60_1]|jgi:hypothetical protein|uniref:hypothetical protein n=1 Tax=Pseudarthrobacter sp. TAF60_1 TaxID=3233071 RepID=UPI003F9AA501